jgi:hypothetical protein
MSLDITLPLIAIFAVVLRRFRRCETALTAVSGAHVPSRQRGFPRKAGVFT